MTESNTSLVDYSRRFAEKAHGSQTYGDLPYVMHLDAVAKYVENYGVNATIVAYLHDVVEDTSVTLKVIENNFGRFISECIQIITDEPGLSRQEKKAKTYAKMAKVSGQLELALVVKAADRLVNMQASLSNNNMRLIDIYKKEYPVFKKSVYRRELCEDLWIRLDLLASDFEKYNFENPLGRNN